jgi:hypothetical protein
MKGGDKKEAGKEDMGKRKKGAGKFLKERNRLNENS